MNHTLHAFTPRAFTSDAGSKSVRMLKDGSTKSKSPHDLVKGLWWYTPNIVAASQTIVHLEKSKELGWHSKHLKLSTIDAPDYCPWDGELYANPTFPLMSMEMMWANNVFDCVEDAQRKVREITKFLASVCNTTDLYEYSGIWNYPFADNSFKLFPASSSGHHCYVGGLLDHTIEVLKIACASYTSLGKPVPFCVVLASLWHDFGKTLDYNPCILQTGDMHVDLTKHYYDTHHVVASWAQFMNSTRALNFADREVVRETAHCILAHHGQMQWGSPVNPHSQEAFAVHFADMISVNVHDTTRLKNRK
jgi:hypothetical protein